MASLANVKYALEFGGKIRSLILDAHKDNAHLPGADAQNVKKMLQGLIDGAQVLNEALREINVGGRSEYVGALLELQLEKTHFKGQPILFLI